MNAVLFGLSMAVTAPTPTPTCAGPLARPTFTQAKRARAFASHLAALGYDADRFRFAVVSLGPPSRARQAEIVEGFTAALAAGHFPLVIDRGDEAEELRQWRAGLSIPREFVEWIGLVARALDHRREAATEIDELIDFESARWALYRQFEITREVVARLVESREYDEFDAFLAVTRPAWPTLATYARERALAFAARPARDVRRDLRCRLLDDEAEPGPDEVDILRGFHRTVLSHRASLLRMTR